MMFIPSYPVIQLCTTGGLEWQTLADITNFKRRTDHGKEYSHPGWHFGY